MQVAEILLNAVHMHRGNKRSSNKLSLDVGTSHPGGPHLHPRSPPNCTLSNTCIQAFEKPKIRRAVVQMLLYQLNMLIQSQIDVEDIQEVALSETEYGRDERSTSLCMHSQPPYSQGRLLYMQTITVQSMRCREKCMHAREDVWVVVRAN
jgi:hypothetical protein